MKQESHFLAIDIGNSHVRLHIGHFDTKKLHLEEVYQFRNQQVFIQGHLLCDLLNIYQGIKKGLFQAGNTLINKISGIGIDSWGVDYALLDQNDNLLSNTYHHTDHRTEGVFENIFKIIPKEEIYHLTGIQFINFNTLPQLYADLINRPWILKEAKSLLFIADFFNFLLTGKKYNEFTMASTSQFFNTREMRWEKIILEKLSIPSGEFSDLVTSSAMSKIVEWCRDYEIELLDPVSFSKSAISRPNREQLPPLRFRIKGNYKINIEQPENK